MRNKAIHRKTHGPQSIAAASRQLYLIGVGMAVLVAGFASLELIYGPLGDIIDGVDVNENSAALTLGISVLFVLPWWFYSPRKNNEIFALWLPNSGVLNRDEQLEWLTVLIIAGTFTSLIFFLTNPIVFCSIFVCYSIAYLVGVRYLHNRVLEAITNQRASLDNDEINATGDDIVVIKIDRSILMELDTYFLKNRHLWRISGMLFCGVVGLVLVLVVEDSADTYSQYLLAATLFLSELIIIYWRRSRDIKLTKLSIARYEYEQDY